MTETLTPEQNRNKLNIVTIAACMIATFCVGVVYIWSVFKAAAIDWYGWDAGSVNLVSSYMLCCFCLGSFFGGILQDRIGPKITAVIGSVMFAAGLAASSFISRDSSIAIFYISYCVISGFGTGFVFTSSLSCMQKWLPNRLGLASGLSVASFALSTVVFSPVFSSLLDSRGMPKVMLFMGIVLGGMGLIACLLIKLPSAEYAESMTKVNINADGAESLSLAQGMKTLPFWCLFLCLFFYNGTWNMLTPLIKGLGMERGLTEAAAVFCVSLTGAFNAAGRLIMSAISDKIGRLTSMYILCGITLLSAIGLTSLGGYGYFAVVLATAFAFGGPAAVFPAFTTDIFGPKYSGRNYGFMMIGLGTSGIVFNIISNRLVEADPSYRLSFIMGAVTAVIAIILLFIIQRSLKKKKQSDPIS